MEKPIKLIAGITVPAVVGVLAFLMFGPKIADKLNEHVFQLSYQFLLLVVVGGGVSWVYKEYEAAKARKRKDVEEFRELYSKLVDGYQSYKSIKRRLRAQAVRQIENTNIVLSEPYSQLMIELNELQLLFEFHKRHVKGKNEFFERVNERYTAGSSLYGDLETVEKYLNTVVKEYESAFRTHKKLPEELSLEKLTYLARFVAPGPNCDAARITAQEAFGRAIDNLAGTADALEYYA